MLAQQVALLMLLPVICFSSLYEHLGKLAVQVDVQPIFPIDHKTQINWKLSK